MKITLELSESDIVEALKRQFNGFDVCLVRKRVTVGYGMGEHEEEQIVAEVSKDFSDECNVENVNDVR